MAKPDPETTALKEQLAEALAQVDSLQAAVADAEARAATHSDRIAALQGELEAARAEGERLGSRLRESALRYREARLAASPHIPPELVTGEELGEIDEQLAAAERVVTEMRERVEKERRQGSPPVPAGSPVRRAPDYSQLPPGEKIKLGLQQIAERETG
jgi:predicted  nucleic acid-binding Zn-ribbon protein